MLLPYTDHRSQSKCVKLTRVVHLGQSTVRGLDFRFGRRVALQSQYLVKEIQVRLGIVVLHGVRHVQLRRRNGWKFGASIILNLLLPLLFVMMDGRRDDG